ncbi:hypothetical protein [Magpiepox virus 2]|nr:hypothetical protein [Magpiepox virus 2]
MIYSFLSMFRVHMFKYYFTDTPTHIYKKIMRTCVLNLNFVNH